jgi:hypothetical protein
MTFDELKTWVTTNVLPMLTVLGVALYVVLRLPYAVYYGTLGAAPEDVGLGYVETLARSAVGVAAIVVIPSVVTAGMIYFVVATALYVRTFRAMAAHGMLVVRKVSKLDDVAYEADRTKRRAVLLAVFRDLTAEEIDAQIARLDEFRSLHRLPERTRGQEARRRALKREISKHGDALFTKTIRNDAGRVARRFGRWLLAVLLVLTLVALPFVAFADAQAVRGCNRSMLGAFGLFAIRGDPASLSRLGDDGTARPVFEGRRLVYLGRNDDEIVLYDCGSGHTLRLPPDGLAVAARY